MSKTRWPSIGEMNRRIFFQEAMPTEDGYGGKINTWVNRFEAWASIEPLTGREYFFAHQVQGEVTRRVRMRFRTDVHRAMRISAGGRILEIESIVDLKEAHQFLEILCRESK